MPTQKNPENPATSLSRALKSVPSLTVVVGTALVACLLTGILLRVVGYPEPYIHDEFAYLLGADTFLEGRITNPTPPASEFFETFHVSMSPSYHSKYPPGQSLFLALGRLIGGKEIFGVWLSYILASAAVCWALLTVAPPRWALLGGMLAAVNHTFLIRWAFSFWGGSVAMLGGALFLGGWLRLCQHPRISAAVWTGLGLFVMAFTRPLEGMLTACIPLMFFLNAVIFKPESGHAKPKIWRVLGILALAGVLILGLNLFYNHALTGSAFTFPHKHWNKAASVHEVIRAYTGSFETSAGFRFQRYAEVFLGPVLWSFVLMALVHLSDFKIRAALCSVLLTSTYTVFTSKAWPHYFAPAVPLLIYLQVQGGRRLCHWKFREMRLGLILFLAALLLHFARDISMLAEQAPKTIAFRAARESGRFLKRDLDEFLEEKPGNHLILVHPLEGHSAHFEYVYNRADIPAAKVIWARDMGASTNQRLFAAYPDRRIWLLQIRNQPVKLTELADPSRYPGLPETRDGDL